MTDEDGSRLGELEGIVGDEDGYEAEPNAAVLLQGLDIPDELHERKMSELQGGQKVRVLLAQALFGDPQALLLDEPTNYLDLESIHWLQDFLDPVQRDCDYDLARPAFSECGVYAYCGYRLRDDHSRTTVAMTTWSFRRPAFGLGSRVRMNSARRRLRS